MVIRFRFKKPQLQDTLVDVRVADGGLTTLELGKLYGFETMLNALPTTTRLHIEIMENTDAKKV